MSEKTNLGVKPLGRGETTSQIVQAETEVWKQFSKDITAVIPVNNEAAAKKNRIAHLNYVKAWDKIHKTKREDIFVKIYKSLGLEI